jgi:hypothetical protein
MVRAPRMLIFSRCVVAVLCTGEGLLVRPVLKPIEAVE